MCSWIRFASILLNIFCVNIHEGDWSVIFFLSCISVWFWYQGNCSLIKRVWQCSFCFYCVEYWYSFFFDRLPQGRAHQLVIQCWMVSKCKRSNKKEWRCYNAFRNEKKKRNPYSWSCSDPHKFFGSPTNERGARTEGGFSFLLSCPLCPGYYSFYQWQTIKSLFKEGTLRAGPSRKEGESEGVGPQESTKRLTSGAPPFPGWEMFVGTKFVILLLSLWIAFLGSQAICHP